MPLLTTPRLQLRALTLDDAGFVLALVNEPGWLRFIGDRNVHSLDDARRFLREGTLALYARHGFGMYAVERSSDGALLGMCGLIQREGLDHVDIGYALFAQHAGQGYAFEAAQAVLAYGNEVFRLERIAAITDADNQRSIRLLQRLGLRWEAEIRLPKDDKPLQLYLQPPPEGCAATEAGIA